MTDTEQRAEAAKQYAEETRKRLAAERQVREERTDKAAKAGAAIKPTPTQNENDQFVLAVASNTLPHSVTHAQDGSPIDPQSPNPTPGTPTWP